MQTVSCILFLFLFALVRYSRLMDIKGIDDEMRSRDRDP